MKHLLIIVLAIGCGVILFLGNAHWNERTGLSTQKTELETKESGSNTEASKAEAPSNTSKITLEEFEILSKNWPDAAKKQFELSLQKEAPFKIVLAGSEALGNDTNGWAQLTKAELEKAYGTDSLEVVIQTYNGTSMDFSAENKAKELAALKPDLILLEPLTLNDNGEVRIEDSHTHISNWIETVRAENPEAVFIIQPPHPIYQASYYPVQVEELKKYTETNEVPYLDHWTAWPDPQGEEILGYLSEEGDVPNKEGHLLWSKFVNEYLISK